MRKNKQKDRPVLVSFADVGNHNGRCAMVNISKLILAKAIYYLMRRKMKGTATAIGFDVAKAKENAGSGRYAPRLPSADVAAPRTDALNLS